MDLLNATILGIIQGLTEFLPISSSGHLVLAKVLFGYEDTGLIFEVFVHFGTVISVIVAFRQDIREILTGFFGGISHPGQWRTIWSDDVNFRLGWLILLGTLPAGIIGLLVEEYVNQAFQNPLLVGLMLLMTALILWSSQYAIQKREQVNWQKSLLIGFAQALAILPGVSRSGTTITAGLWLKLSAEDAAKFSFFLAVPVILGASGIKLVEIFSVHLSGAQTLQVIAGTVAAFVSGWLAIIFLMDILRKGKFSWFALYCFIVGGVTITISVF